MTTSIVRRELTTEPLERQQLGAEQLVEVTGFSIPELALMRSDGGVAAGTTNAELLQFILQARARGLDPRKGQAYYIKRGGRWTFTTAITGFAAIADRTGRLAGIDAPDFRGELEVKDGGRTVVVPVHAEVTVWKIVGPWEHPQTRPFRGTADWTEFYPGDGDIGRMWRKMPRRMLSKCAQAQALRLAFPEQLGELELEADNEVTSRVIEVAESPARTLPQGATYDRYFPPEAEETTNPAGDVVNTATGEVLVSEDRLIDSVRHPLYQRYAALIEEAGKRDIKFEPPTLPMKASRLTQLGLELKARLEAAATADSPSLPI